MNSVQPIYPNSRNRKDEVSVIYLELMLVLIMLSDTTFSPRTFLIYPLYDVIPMKGICLQRGEHASSAKTSMLPSI